MITLLPLPPERWSFAQAPLRISLGKDGDTRLGKRFTTEKGVYGLLASSA